jgi:hypothetical protein
MKGRIPKRVEPSKPADPDEARIMVAERSLPSEGASHWLEQFRAIDKAVGLSVEETTTRVRAFLEEKARSKEPNEDSIRARALLEKFEKIARSKEPGYTGKAPSSEAAVTEQPPRMPDDEEFKTHDLNALAADLGYRSFEEAAAVLTAGKKPPRVLSSDPLSVARRTVRRYQRRHTKDPNFPPSPEVLAAFRVISKGNYPGVKANRAAKKLAM